jgi:hypothetical protein
MLVDSRRKAARAAANIAKDRARDGVAKKASSVHGSHSSVGDAMGETTTRAARLERELLEIALSDPTAVEVLRSSVHVDEFEQLSFRRLLGICYRLVEEGQQPSYDKVMSAAEDPVLKQLVVTLESAARDKAQKLRLDCALESHEEYGGRHALLAKLIEQLKQRADAQDASLERLALQSGLSGSGPSGESHPGTGSAGVLDAAQKEALRRATEIHGLRAGRRGATQDRASGRDESSERASGRANAKTTN